MSQQEIYVWVCVCKNSIFTTAADESGAIYDTRLFEINEYYHCYRIQEKIYIYNDITYIICNEKIAKTYFISIRLTKDTIDSSKFQLEDKLFDSMMKPIYLHNEFKS